LLKPSELTASGYRLYDDKALQRLQQILFFKELDFKLKEIKEILQKPDFDKILVFKRQKELLLLKRNRTDRLIQLLSRLEKGEPCMSFKEFDLSDYITALEDFKNNSTDDVIKYWGSMENFDLFIQKINDDDTEAMKHNLEHFSELMETQLTEEAKEIGKHADMLYDSLTADLSEDVSSPKTQSIVHELLQFIQKNSANVSLGKPYINVLLDAYASDYIKNMADSKYGKGASDYIVKAFRYYLKNSDSENR